MRMPGKLTDIQVVIADDDAIEKCVKNTYSRTSMTA